MKDPVYERRTRVTMRISAGWTLNFPPALYCDKKCSACKYRIHALLAKCDCSMIVLCGDALPDEGLANALENQAWIQYQQGFGEGFFVLAHR